MHFAETKLRIIFRWAIPVAFDMITISGQRSQTQLVKVIIVKYIHSSNTSTTFYKVSTGYMFRSSWAIIGPYI